MKVTADTENIVWETEALNEMETADVIAWNEMPEWLGQSVPVLPTESEETIIEQLVNAGNDEASREQREAAEESEEA